ncbi:MAG: cysteine desulfurase [Bacilli bacterium]|nr:cysteine desulfurase [Bacilli bacterium]
MYREDFNILNSGIIYFDNGATTLKPKILSEVVADYYNNYSSNAHRGDYSLSIKASSMYEETRNLVKEMINANKASEIAFTSGTTDSINKIVFGFFKYHLSKGDEVLLTKSEHASNLLPWFELADELGIKIKYIELDSNHEVKLENVEKAITNKTKVISIAHISNVVGDVRPVEDIVKLAHSKGILVLIDGAQSVPHIKVDVQKMDVDFLAFSAHKMCGPTGVGVIYGKEKLLNEIRPIIFGGGMNADFSHDGVRIYKTMPDRLEAGTPNVAGVIGFGYVIKYLMNIGFDNIQKKELELKKYLVKRLKEIKEITIYNEYSESGIVTINYEGIFPQDLSIYLDKYNICTRAGNHCAKILKDEIHIKNTCRISLYFYNCEEEIDKLILALKNPKIKEDIIF